jgi:hypothetical protein
MCLANVVSHTCTNPSTVLQNARTRCNTRRMETSVPEVAESDADREARLCGETDSTGILCADDGRSELERKKSRTSVCD